MMAVATREEASQSSSTRRRSILALVVLATALSNLEVGLVNVALPTIAEIFDAGPTTIQWVAIAYQLAIIGTLVLFGRLVDLFGGRPLYLGGMAIFAGASLLAVFSPHVIWLILARGLLGLGAAMLLATGQALLAIAYPDTDRGRALGFMHMAVAGGLMAGPSVGGLLVTAVGWRAVFLAPLPLAGAALWWAWKSLPRPEDRHREQIDLVGAASVFAIPTITVFALTRMAQDGWEMWTGGLLALVLLASILFIRVERRRDAPVVDPDLLSRPDLAIGLLATHLTFVALASNMFLVPFALQDLMGRSAAEAGLLMMAVPVSILPVAPLAGALADRLGSPLPASTGLVLIIVAIVGMARFTAVTPTWFILASLVVYGIGAGLFQAPNNRAVLGAGRDGRAGIVSGMLALSRNLGQVAGVAVASAVWTWRQTQYEQQGISLADALGAGLRDAFVVLVIVGLLALATSTARFRLKGQRHGAR